MYVYTLRYSLEPLNVCFEDTFPNVSGSTWKWGMPPNGLRGKMLMNNHTFWAYPIFRQTPYCERNLWDQLRPCSAGPRILPWGLLEGNNTDSAICSSLPKTPSLGNLQLPAARNNCMLQHRVGEATRLAQAFFFCCKCSIWTWDKPRIFIGEMDAANSSDYSAEYTDGVNTWSCLQEANKQAHYLSLPHSSSPFDFPKPVAIVWAGLRRQSSAWKGRWRWELLSDGCSSDKPSPQEMRHDMTAASWRGEGLGILEMPSKAGEDQQKQRKKGGTPATFGLEFCFPGLRWPKSDCRPYICTTVPGCCVPMPHLSHFGALKHFFMHKDSWTSTIWWTAEFGKLLPSFAEAKILAWPIRLSCRAAERLRLQSIWHLSWEKHWYHLEIDWGPEFPSQMNLSLVVQ